MNTLLVSFVLIHAVWLLGYAAYRLLAGRDTFFRLRRTLLLGLSLAAVALAPKVLEFTMSLPAAK